jgi:hypothetical protein
LRSCQGYWDGRNTKCPPRDNLSGMPFAIQWTGITGPTTTRRDTALEALKCATELLGKGRYNVVIVDLAEGGKAYAPEDFAQFYLNHGK